MEKTDKIQTLVILKKDISKWDKKWSSMPRAYVDNTDEPNKLVLQISEMPKTPERYQTYSKQKSLSNSESSLSSSQCSPQPVLDKKATYWTIHRGDKLRKLNFI